MTVATEIKTLTTDVSAAIAGRETWGRVELEKLRRRLGAIESEQRRETTKGTVSRLVFDELCGAIEQGAADLAGRAKFAQSRVAQ